MRWVRWRNGVLASPGFQAAAARLPLVRRIAHSRARQVFDLVAGFTYSQILFAAVESGLLDLLATDAKGLAEIAARTGLSEAAATRLLGAMTALDLTEEVEPGRWMLGQQGAVIRADRGVQAMIRHHRLLYADLADPLALLKQDRAQPTALSAFWTYVRENAASDRTVTPYSELMAISQAMVSREVLGAYDFGRHHAVLDVGGGHGTFARALATAHRGPRLGIFDLPDVARETAALVEKSALAGRCAVHAGDFFRDPLPQGYDCITLVRILHDHDDEAALRLLLAIRKALPHGGRLVIAEPMNGTHGARAMGAYFSMYLWAMGSGRPRSTTEIGALLKSAGFRSWTGRTTRQPLVASVIVTHI
jgi:demethylspheroidene O-methyltransferase